MSGRGSISSWDTSLVSRRSSDGKGSYEPILPFGGKSHYPVDGFETDGFSSRSSSSSKHKKTSFRYAKLPSGNNNNNNNMSDADSVVSAGSSKDRVDVNSMHEAFQTASAVSLLLFIIYMTYFSVLLLFLAIPMLSSVPGGFFDDNGMFKFISIGFKQHSALASFIWGVCTTFIGFTRLLSVVLYIKRPFNAIAYGLLITVTMGAGIVTVRYDEVEEMHIAAAGVWIASSLIFYGVVGAFNGIYSQKHGGIGMKITWSLNVACALLFLTFIIKFNSAGRNPQDFLIAGINEYATAFLILCMDFQIAFSIHTRFLWSAGLFSQVECCCCAPQEEEEQGMPV